MLRSLVSAGCGLCLTAGLTGCGKSGDGSLHPDPPPDVVDAKMILPVRSETIFQVSTGSLGIKRKMAKLAIWHEATEGVSGILEVKAFGDVAGTGGRGDNADILPMDHVPPGKNAQTIFYYYMTNETLDKNPDMSPEEAGRNVRIAILVRYIPLNQDTPWREHEWLFAFQNGDIEIVDTDDLTPEWAQWMADRGIDTSRLTTSSS